MTLSTVSIVVLLTTELFVQPSRALLLAIACFCFLSLGLAWPDFLGVPLAWGAGAVLTLVAALAAYGGALLAYGGALLAPVEPVAVRPLLARPGPVR
jgi:hypothetical protein